MWNEEVAGVWREDGVDRADANGENIRDYQRSAGHGESG